MRRSTVVLAVAAISAVSATGIVGTLLVTDPLARPAANGPHRSTDGSPTEVELEWEFGVLVWSVDVMQGVVEYDVDIDATTGEVLRYGPDD